MLNILGNVIALFKIQTVTIDNNVFRLHYKSTLALIMLFSIIVGSRQYFGDPIDCTIHNKDFERVIDNYCWSHLFVKKSGRHISSPAQQNSFHNRGNDIADKTYLFHYQWVGFILFFQALLFFIPRYLWKFCWEEARVKGLAESLKTAADADVQMQKMRAVIEYFSKNRGNHQFYFFKYVLCEILNVVNVIGQLVIIDRIFEKVFSKYTFWNFEIVDFMVTVPDKRIDDMHWIFPQVAECELKVSGYTGGNMDQVSLCVIPVNIFAEKIYIILWFWLLVLTVPSVLVLVYRVVTICSPQLRVLLILRKTKTLKYSQLRKILRQVDIGDWFLMYLIGKNVDPIVLGDLLQAFDTHRKVINTSELLDIKF